MNERVGQEFMQQTSLDVRKREPVSPQSQGLPQPPLELEYPAGAVLIDLPAPASLNIPVLDVRTAIERRKTVRHYSDEAISLDELAYLLWLSQGVKRVSDRPATLRNVPSAGARHAFETLLLVNRVVGLEPGLYRYVALKHALLAVDLSPEIADRVVTGCLEQKQVHTSAVTFIWTAVVERMYWRYMERGYRYLHLDAGHVCQNLYLAAETIQCGVCAIAAFDDGVLNQALGLDGEKRFVVYLGSLGRRAV